MKIIAVHGWLAVVLAGLFAAPTLAHAQRQMERLGRGMIALRNTSTQVYVGWRLLGNDPVELGFNLYRSANGGGAVKLNTLPLTNTTDYVDLPANLATTSYIYSVKPVLNGVEVADIWANPLAPPAVLPTNAPVQASLYVRVPLQATPDGAYDVKFCWVGDLDGDGEYDFVVDRQPPGETRQFLEAYRRNGALLWRMDLGYNSTNHYNIEPGSSTVSVGHGDNVTVFDLDGDGLAEVLVRTAKGVVFADGTVVGGTDDRVQYLSVVDGLTGVEKARATVPSPFLADGQMNGHMGILYCDGVRPSVFWHSTNRRADSGFNAMATTWDYRHGGLTQRWSRLFNTLTHEAAGHQIRLGDPDNDGKDEYLDVGHGLDDDGTQLYAVNAVNHGDRFHIGDLNPDRPGLETFVIQQDNPSGLATALYESATGKIIKSWYAGGVVDVGRGDATDFDPASKGSELVSTQPGIFDCKGNQIYAANFFPAEAIWWDADLSREFLQASETVRISKVVNGGLGYFDLIDKNTDAPGGYLAYGGRPAFWGDLFGDWREELLVVENGNGALRIYTSDYAATNRLYTLMHNPQYRDQTTTKGYVQASMVDYFLGTGMTPPPPPPQSMAKLIWRGAGGQVWDSGTANWETNWFYAGNTNTNAATFTAGDSVLFDLTGSNHIAITLSDALTPGDVTVYTPKDYTFSGAGSLGGTMKLTKQGKGSLTLAGTNTFSGATTVWDGALVVNGDLQSSPVTVWGGIWGGPLAAGQTGGRVSGTGRFSQPVTLRYRGAISPGSGLSNAGTLTFASGLKTEDGATFALDLSDDPSGTVKPNDRVNIVGNLTLSGTNTLAIHLLNATLPAGLYPLINYSGTFSGSLSNLKISGLDGLPVGLTNPPGQIALLVKTTRAATTITWTGGQGGNVWDVAVTTNWFNGAGKDIFVPGDTVRFVSPSNLTANLVGSLAVANIVVDSPANYVFSGSGSLVGAASLVKSNTGTLTISTLNNAFTGRTVIAGGLVVVPKLDAVGFPSPLGNPGASPTNLVLSGNATLRLTGEAYTDRGMTLNSGTNSLDVYNGTDQFTCAGQLVGSGALKKLGGGLLAVTRSNSYTGGTIIASGSLSLQGGDGNRYGIGPGPVTFLNGTLSLMDIQSSYGYGYNFSVPTNGTGRLDCDGRSYMTGALTGGGTFTVMTPYVRTDFNGNWSAFTGQLNLISDDDGGSFRCNHSAGYPNAKVNIANGVSFQTRVGGTPTITIGELSGALGGNVAGGTGNDGRAVNWSVGGLNTSATFAGNTYNNVGFIKVGTGTWTWTGTNLTHTGPTTINGGTLQIGNGGTTGMLSPGNVTDNATLAFNRSNFITDTNFGLISGTGQLAKRGAGQLALTKAHSYAGATTIESGTLALTGYGAIANSSNISVSAGALLDVSGTTSGAMTLAGGKKISGFGSVKGNFTVGSGATLAPGGSLGTLTFSNTLTLAAGSTNLFEITKAPLTNDQVRVFGALTNGGTLIVTNIGATALAAGDSFKLFNAASYQGAFSQLGLPPLPAGLGWNTNALNTSGTLAVVVTAQPVLGLMAVTGSGLWFYGTGGVANANYYLLGTTNLTTPSANWLRLRTNQFDASGNFNFTNPLPPGVAQIFYQLQVP